MSIEQLREQIQACTKCGLSAKLPAGCRPVPGNGPINAKLFIIGESLGREESIMEEPFVGMCGEFLTQCLAKVGINRSECYISNCLKCRPTDTGKKNRPPTEQEYNSCINWLFEEMAIVKPKAILGLGGFAARTMYHSKKIKISQVAGNIEERNFPFEFKFICTYHPSYIVSHGRHLQDQFIQHLKKVKELAYGI